MKATFLTPFALREIADFIRDEEVLLATEWEYRSFLEQLKNHPAALEQTVENFRVLMEMMQRVRYALVRSIRELLQLGSMAYQPAEDRVPAGEPSSSGTRGKKP